MCDDCSDSLVGGTSPRLTYSRGPVFVPPVRASEASLAVAKFGLANELQCLRDYVLNILIICATMSNLFEGIR